MEPRERLNKMYWAGYCNATIRHASTTGEDGRGRNQRMKWAQSHYNNCEECKLASIITALRTEANAAARFGGSTVYIEFAKVLRRAIDRGVVTRSIYEWLDAQEKRQGEDWTGRTEPGR